MVELEIEGHVAILTIDRPEARNAVNGAVASSMEAHIDRVEEDDELWIAIVAGNGPVFSAGADLKEVAAGNGAALGTKRGGFGGIARRERSKPFIAAVDGPALAGGCEIVLSCDLVVASDAARFGIPEVKRSLIAGAGGLFRLPRALPRNVAMELALTGDPIPAQRAYDLGLVNVLCEAGTALDEAKALAQRIEVNAPVAVRNSRRVVAEGMLASDDEAWRLTNELMAEVMRTDDFQEGPRAFIEKRAPRWTGR
ncbi:MAG: crotonase/enoyl-CoA hydratase family protein [Actinomycetota bacterium]